MKNRLDLVGKKFNKVTVTSFSKLDKNNNALWECLCDCGNTKIFAGYQLQRGKIFSCGCERRYRIVNRKRVEHGGRMDNKVTSEYRSWQHMKDRCLNKNNHAYNRYGGRGIKVCDRWLESFDNFFTDMGKKPFGCNTIERINNDGNYELGNCKWESRSNQMKNTSTSKLVLDTNTGIFYISIKEAAESRGKDYSTLSQMLNGIKENVTSLILV